MADEMKPSFIGSVTSGIGGFIKGAFSGGLVGAVAGAAVAGVLALTGVAATAAILPAAVYTAIAFGVIGSAAGTSTAVANKQREANGAIADKMAEVANVAFSQGVTVGRNLEVAEDVQKSFREKIEKERAAAGQNKQR